MCHSPFKDLPGYNGTQLVGGLPYLLNLSQEKVFVFVPYNTPPSEQERIYQDVRRRMTEDSEHEQFIYDQAIIPTNRG